MGPTALFNIIYRSHYTISANFYFYLQYFQQKVFNFSKISEFQTDPKPLKTFVYFSQLPVLLGIGIQPTVFLLRKYRSENL